MTDKLLVEKNAAVDEKSVESIKEIKNITEGARKSNLADYIVEKFFLLCGILAVVLLILIVSFLIKQSLPAFTEIGLKEFLTGKRWMPSAANPNYGALPLILSSLFVTIGALALAIPWGIFSAMFIAEVAPRKIKEILKPLVEILAIFPSVVLGFIALVILGPFIAQIFGMSHGLTGLTAAVILSVMALPTIISISEDALNSVPNDYREASYALGATKWETVRSVSLPAASSGIVAAIMLGFGRAIGETMVVLMAAGNALNMPVTEFLGMSIPTLLKSVRTLTATIAIEGSDVAWGSLHYHSLFMVGLILFVITFTVNLIADIMLSRFQEVNKGD